MQLTFRAPCRDEMPLRARWMADPDLMSYNAGWPVDHTGYDAHTGCIDFPEAEHDAWFARFVGSPPDGTAYWFVEMDGEVVGHAHHRPGRSNGRRAADIGLMVTPAFRGRGLGGSILCELVTRCFAAGFDVVHNEFETTREAAARAHRRAGFLPVPGSAERVGERTVVLWELPREAWLGPVALGLSGPASPCERGDGRCAGPSRPGPAGGPRPTT